MNLRGGCFRLCVLFVAGLVLIGCTGTDRLFNAMDVDVAATDGSGNPTELLITDLGKDWFACGGDSKIIRVNLSGDILWAFDQDTYVIDGAHNADLNLSEDQMIISDFCNDRVLVIEYPLGDIIWDSSADCPELNLIGPNDANFLGDGIEDGNILVTLRYEHWVVEVNPSNCNGVPDDGEIAWSWGVRGDPRTDNDPGDPDRLLGPHNADMLPNGNVIIADAGVPAVGADGRVIEIDYASKQIAWIYRGRNDCTVKGVPGMKCPALGWARDSDVECDNPACDTGMVVIPAIHQTVGVLRDLNEAPPPGESIPRGREVPYQVQVGEGFAYDSDLVPQWDDDDNNGLGFFLVSNHGPNVSGGNWVRVVPVDADAFDPDRDWELRGVQ